MSENNNHIDRPIRKSLKQFQESPPEGVWSGIKDVLNQERRKTRIAWVGRIAAAAALIIAAGSVWLMVQRTPDSKLGESGTQESISDRQELSDAVKDSTPGKAQDTPGEELKIPEELAEDTPETEQEIPRVLAQETPGEEQNIPEVIAQVTPGTEQGSLEQIRGQRTLDVEQEGISGPPVAGEETTMLQAIDGKYIFSLPSEGPDPVYTLAVNTPARVSYGAEEGIDVFEEFGDKGYSDYNKWAVGGQVSPIYSYRNLDASMQTPAATSYYNEIENGIVSYSGGVNLNYFPAKRLSLQSGLYYSRLGISIPNTYLTTVNQEVSQIDFFLPQQAVANSSGQIELDENKGNTLLDGNSPTREEAPDATATYTENWGEPEEVREGELLQHFKYLEIPLILRYRVVDRRVGLNLLGGISTNFLVGNSVYFKEGGSKEYLGTTGDIKLINYSSVVGVGLQYSIRRNLHINMEPTFRYYLNSINTATGIGSHPYSLGFFTGLSYSF